MRSRSRKDLAASFHRLRRMVIDVKSARKSLVAHHSLIAELVSVALYPSSKESLQRDDREEERSFPLSDLPPSPPTRSPFPPLQLNHLQEEGIESLSSFPCSFASLKNSQNPTFSSLRSLTLKISASLTTSAAKNGKISRVSPPHQEADSNCCKVLPPVAHPGKRLPQSAFWASLFFVFLCFFVYTGKAIAVVVAISAYTIIWVTRRLRSLDTQPYGTSNSVSSHLQEKEGSNLSRSASDKSSLLSSSDCQVPIKNRFLPTLCGSLQEEVCSKEHDLALHAESCVERVSDSERIFTRVKLNMTLVLAFCGLAYGYVAAVCMCSCCMLLLSATQWLTFRRRSF